ncbi:MAG: DUF308 domain-containing protein [Clostridia bacterium]|nr:DUF308 domain-containing protein [Clostridia bacterium]MBR3593339.1 DUF308 domain-containing protein [Clostridia bacterium]
MKGKLAKFLKDIRKEYIISSAVIIVLGIILAFFPKASTEMLGYLVAAFFLICGAVAAVNHFKTEEKNFLSWAALIAGALLMILGIFLFVKPLIIANILWLIFGVVLVVDGVYKLLNAITLAKSGADRWWTVLITAAVCAILGFIIVFKHEMVAIGFVRFIGIAFIVDGACDLFATGYLSSVIKVLERAAEAEDKPEVELIETDDEIEVEIVEPEE